MAKQEIRRIAVVSGSRADYGLLRGLLQILRAAKDVDLQLVVCGAHLMPRFGSTVREIEADGFSVAARVALPLEDDSPASAATAVGKGIVGFADAFAALRPDILVLLGDRYEMLAAGTVATLFNLPIAHIHGGEVTEGAFDDAIRHALTKMAFVHFVAAEPYRRRVIQLGENPRLVFTVGAPGLDQLAEGETLDRTETLRQLGLPAARGFLLVTVHPATARPDLDRKTVDALLGALEHVRDRSVVFTGVNADPGNAAIDAAIRGFVGRHPDRARLFVSLGTRLYLAALRHADAVVGNSSSGIIEAPAVGTPSINIGERQTGRLRAASVIDCKPDAHAIAAALKKALASGYRRRFRKMKPPYGRGGASARIARVLRTIDIASYLPKRFHDISKSRGKDRHS